MNFLTAASVRSSRGRRRGPEPRELRRWRSLWSYCRTHLMEGDLAHGEPRPASSFSPDRSCFDRATQGIALHLQGDECGCRRPSAKSARAVSRAETRLIASKRRVNCDLATTGETSWAWKGAPDRAAARSTSVSSALKPNSPRWRRRASLSRLPPISRRRTISSSQPIQRRLAQPASLQRLQVIVEQVEDRRGPPGPGPRRWGRYRRRDVWPRPWPRRRRGAGPASFPAATAPAARA